MATFAARRLQAMLRNNQLSIDRYAGGAAAHAENGAFFQASKRLTLAGAGITPATSWAGEHGWHGKLVCDDFSGYKACFEMGVTEAGWLAHARRKFHELWGQSPQHHRRTGFETKRDVRELDAAHRKRIRQERARPVADSLHLWLAEQRKKVPEGSATAKAIDCGLGRWPVLTRYIDDGELPADNNWVENQIRPIALGRSNWLFAGSLRAGKRAAAVMSLVHSARLNGHDPTHACATSWSGCPRIRPVATRSCCRTAGRPHRQLPDRPAVRQHGINARLRSRRAWEW